MSCNGCRVLRKGCSEDCMLRDCLKWIQNPQAQANATVFVTKFFGRATLLSFLSSVPPNQRPGLFQSLMLGVEQVLGGSGGALTPLPDLHECTEKGSSSGDHQQELIMMEENYYNELEETQSERVVGGRCHQAKKQRTERHESEESESSTLGSRTERTEDCSYVYANSQTHQRKQLLTLFL
ncbi:hypothetical protein P8452_05107 [Trifolium repens]|nr:hypothetical protein P8452_05107 [Trifolium repens]